MGDEGHALPVGEARGPAWGSWVVVCTAGMAAMVAALLEGDQGEQILEVYWRAAGHLLLVIVLSRLL